jgi:hypothetical protein
MTVKIALRVTPNMKMNKKIRWSVWYRRVSKIERKMSPTPPRVAPAIAQYERTFSDLR